MKSKEELLKMADDAEVAGHVFFSTWSEAYVSPQELRNITNRYYAVQSEPAGDSFIPVPLSYAQICIQNKIHMHLEELTYWQAMYDAINVVE
jgi:hypothetical protein